MKKLFTEPEIEILAFLCNNDGIDSADVGLGDDTAAPGGDAPLIPKN